MPEKNDDLSPFRALHDFVTGKVFDDAAPAPTKDTKHEDEREEEADDDGAERANAERTDNAKRKRKHLFRAADKRPTKRADDAAGAEEEGPAAGEQDEADGK